MSGFRVVVCGGGIAAVEAVLRLRRLLGDEPEITMLAPSDELRYRPLAVQEPFARPGARRYSLRQVTSRTGVQLVQDSLEWVDADAQAAHASDGTALPYDALLLAVGARSAPPLAHVTTFDDARADETYLGIVQDIEEGYNKRLAIVVPEGPTWPFPAYELALQTADRAYAAGFDDLDITLVTPEDKPVQVFGERASAVVEEMLSGVGVRVITGSRAEVPANRRLVAHPSGEELEPELIVALPRLEGPGIRGLPSGHGGFAPIDEGCRIVGAEEHVFAAGDVTDFPVKQGGIGAQQADVAAAGIAALAGDHEREVLAPVLRGALIAGERRRLYLQCRLEGGRPVDSEVLDEPPWEADEKVVAQELGPFLHTLEPRR